MKKKMFNILLIAFVLFMAGFMMFADQDLVEEHYSKSIHKSDSTGFNYTVATYQKTCDIERFIINLDRIFFYTYGYTINDYTLLNKGGIK